MIRIALLLVFIVAAPLSAATIFGMRSDDHLIRFDSATPGTITDIGLITGLSGGAGENAVGIDFRPADGALYLFTVNSALVMTTYTLNTTTAAATLVGATAAGVAGLSPTEFHGIAFNATVDRVRVVNSQSENCRINPTTGALAGNDTDLTPAGPEVIAAAYDRNYAGAPLTTLYGIERTGSNLVRIGGIDGSPSPNGGVVTTIGALSGFSYTLDAGMAIDPMTGVCFASFTSLYTINLSTGAATLVGAIGAGTQPVLSVSVQPSANVTPTVTLPAAQATPADTSLVLTGATAITLSDADAGINPLELQVNVSSGTISFATTAGLAFTVGNGFDDIVIVCTGTLANLNAALATVTYEPATGFNGAAMISLGIADGGASGFGGPQASSATLSIAVGNVGGGGGGGGGDDESSCSTAEGSSAWLLLGALLSVLCLAARLRESAAAKPRYHG